jgi:pyrroloquinoline quinone (PQQ) biosynthesis protein C
MSNQQDYKFDDRRFKSIITKSEVTGHRFFELIQEETTQSKILIRRFVEADYLVAKGFGQFLAYLISLVDDPETRMLLIGNLWDEHGLGNPKEIHFELYKSLLNSLEVQEPSVKTANRSEFLQLHYDISSKSVLNGIAIFTYANEFLSMFEFSQIRVACKRHFKNVNERYFEVNQRADIIHTKQLEAVLGKMILTQAAEDDAVSAINTALISRTKMYDEVVASSTICN